MVINSLSIYLVLGTSCSILCFDLNLTRQVSLASNQGFVNHLYCFKKSYHYRTTELK